MLIIHPVQECSVWLAYLSHHCCGTIMQWFCLLGNCVLQHGNTNTWNLSQILKQLFFIPHISLPSSLSLSLAASRHTFLSFQAFLPMKKNLLLRASSEHITFSTVTIAIMLSTSYLSLNSSQHELTPFQVSKHLLLRPSSTHIMFATGINQSYFYPSNISLHRLASSAHTFPSICVPDKPKNIYSGCPLPLTSGLPQTSDSYHWPSLTSHSLGSAWTCGGSCSPRKASGCYSHWRSEDSTPGGPAWSLDTEWWGTSRCRRLCSYPYNYRWHTCSNQWCWSEGETVPHSHTVYYPSDILRC